MRFLLFFVLVILPVLETILFVLLGMYWGWMQTVLLTFITSFLGFSLSKYYQFCAKSNLEKALAGELPDGHIMDNMMLYLACFLLILPGFITDVLGFILLVPWGRKLVILLVGKRLSASATSGMSSLGTSFFLHTMSSGMDHGAFDDVFNSPRSASSRPDSQSPNSRDDDIIDVDFEVKH